MKFVDLRRHSVRDRAEESLSVAGRELAREIGRSSGPFRRIVSSPARRAVETVEWMGLRADSIDPIWLDLGGLPWPHSFAEYRGLMEHDAGARTTSARLHDSLREILAEIGERESALVVTHGGVLELAVVPWVSSDVATSLGPPAKCMEGVRLGVVGQQCTTATALRVPGDRTRI